MRKMKFVAMALTAALALQFTVPAFAAQLPETEAAPEQAATAEAPDEVQAEALEEENLIEFRTLVRYASNTHPSETVSVGFTSNTNYSWSSSDTSVVTVDQKGRVSAVGLGEATVARASAVAWSQGLRGYDAVHLACALMWQESLGDGVTLATYDRELWRGAGAGGLVPWPERMP